MDENIKKIYRMVFTIKKHPKHIRILADGGVCCETEGHHVFCGWKQELIDKYDRQHQNPSPIR